MVGGGVGYRDSRAVCLAMSSVTQDKYNINTRYKHKNPLYGCVSYRGNIPYSAFFRFFSHIWISGRILIQFVCYHIIEERIIGSKVKFI